MYIKWSTVFTIVVNSLLTFFLIGPGIIMIWVAINVTLYPEMELGALWPAALLESWVFWIGMLSLWNWILYKPIHSLIRHVGKLISAD